MRALMLLLLSLAGCSERAWSDAAPGLDRVVLSVYAFSGRDVWAVGGPLGSAGDTLVLHDEGSGFRPLVAGTPARETLWWVHGAAPESVYLVGERGVALRWDGSALSPIPTGTSETLFGIWGTDDELWAVGGTPGASGVLLHGDASGLAQVALPMPTGALYKVWGAGPRDVFAVGEGGLILHWDGAAWAQQPSGLPITTTLFTVHGRSGSEVYAVGGLGHGVALRYDGAAWAPLADPLLDTVGSLAGVSVASDGTLLLVGEAGLKLRGRPGALVDDSAEPPYADLHGAFARPEVAFASGGNWLAPAGSARQGVLYRR